MLVELLLLKYNTFYLYNIYFYHTIIEGILYINMLLFFILETDVI